MRHSTHAIDETEGEKLEKVQLEGGWSPAVTKVKDGKVFVVIVLQEVSDDSEKVEEIDL